MRQPKLTSFSALLRSHLRGNLVSLVVAALAIAGYAIAEILAPWPLKIILDHILLENPLPVAAAFLAPLLRAHPERAILAVSSAILLISLLKGAFSYVQVFVTSRVGYQMVHKIRQVLFAHVQRLSISFHQRSKAGELLTKITSDTAVLKDVFSGGLLELLGHTVTLAGMFAVLLLLNPRLALVAALSFPLLAAAMFTIYRRGKTTARRQREREGRVAAHIGEVLSLTPLVRAFAREQLEEDRFARESAATLDESIRTARVEAAAGRAVEIINAAGVWAVVLYGGLLALRREITPGDLLVFAAYLTAMYKPLRNLAKLSAQYSKAMASAERIEQLLATETDEANRPGGVDPGPLRGDIEFDNVTFGYNPASPILRGISFRIRAGEHVALAGASGAGKSTIASLLLRFYQPQSGTVRVDGRDIREFDAEAYRRQIGVVLQDSLLFGSTVAENIAYGKPGAQRFEILAAAWHAGAHQFIQNLPDGYDTVLNERATVLSGGQRQRLCLSRAFLKQPPLLILDEPTAAVDAESAALIHRSIAELQQGKTAIMIAHHFHRMEQFDRILVMQNGVVAEEGTHAQLVQRDGLYAGLYRLQQNRPAGELITQ
ncbi:MAG: ABC transporter ATP-binding protein [Bryobacterales bacterium]|nr:ABC transporter ATP-binding protein [Bryobacterales bacterium]